MIGEVEPGRLEGAFSSFLKILVVDILLLFDSIGNWWIVVVIKRHVLTEQKSMFYRLYLLSKQSKAMLSLYTTWLDGLGFKSLNLATYLKSQRHELSGIIDKYSFVLVLIPWWTFCWRYRYDVIKNRTSYSKQTIVCS